MPLPSRAALLGRLPPSQLTRFGAVIDDYECVVRMNHAPTDGYEELVGSRTTVRVVQATNLPKMLGEKARENNRKVLLPTEEIIIAPGPEHFFSDKAFRIAREQYRRLGLKAHFVWLTPESMSENDEAFERATGINRAAGEVWLSTSWFAVFVASRLCERTHFYGAGLGLSSLEDDAIPNTTKAYYFDNPGVSDQPASGGACRPLEGQDAQLCKNLEPDTLTSHRKMSRPWAAITSTSGTSSTWRRRSSGDGPSRSI